MPKRASPKRSRPLPRRAGRRHQAGQAVRSDCCPPTAKGVRFRARGAPAEGNIAFWLALEPERRNVAEQAVLAVPDVQVALSVVSLWELRVKWNRRFVSGERKGPVHPADVLAWYEGNDVAIVAMTGALAIAEAVPPLDHSDPFDELLVAQAQQTGRRLLTRDARLSTHPVALIAA